MNPVDVAIVGTGPTGLVLAHLLAQQGVQVLLVERESAPANEARAVSIDDESLRTLQTTGTLEGYLPLIVQGYGVHYYSWRNQAFAQIDPSSKEYGHPKRNAFRQQQLVMHLHQTLLDYPNVRLLFEHTLHSFEQDAAGVTLQLTHQQQTVQHRARYLVGCDGGRSTVRQRLGIAWKGSTYEEKWLIADLIGRTSAFRHTRTYCDPRRPAIRLPGPQSTLRYEFMLKPGESPEQALQDATLRQWIRERDPADAHLTLLRKVVYTFHARVATRWQQDRVLMAGDAVHLTPPFAGQGMNSGLRDATNLAWKLALLVRGHGNPALLASYEQERAPHAWALIRMALQIGTYMQPKSIWGAALAQGLLRLVCCWPAARDYVLHLKFKPKARFFQGFFVSGEHPAAQIPAGQLMPQPQMQLPNGQLRWLDDLLGTGFAVVQWADAPPVPWPSELPVRVLHVMAHADDFWEATSPCVRDAQQVLAQVLNSAGAHSVVLRPDRYVLAYVGSARDAQRLTELLTRYGLDNQANMA